MLKFLHIENIAVIEHSDIEFKPGFNVLTGETGAGKSILIDAINAVLGERVSKDLIRNGCDNAVVTAVFGDIDSKTCEILKAYDITPDEDGNILISRKLSLNGKGIIKINGLPVTATILREIAQCLINIHGQHDNQALMVPENHLGYIDAIADNGKLINDYYTEFKNFNSIRKELKSLEMDEDEKARKIDILNYQINEIETAGIRAGEIEQLKSQLKIADSYEKTFKSLSSAEFILSGDDNNDGVLTQLRNANKHLALADIIDTQKLNEALSLLEDFRAELGGFLNNSEYSSLDSNEINQRLDYITRIVLKYGGSEESTIEFLANASRELDTIQMSDKRIIELSGLLDDSTEKLIALAEKLTQSRKKAALRFETQVCDILKELNMPNVKFAVDFQKGKYTKLGCDCAEFMISANAGETLKPLHKIASGGELSRIMLAIKNVLADADNIGTMIFDEIDTGVSGRAAQKIAMKLRQVSEGRQVICVTHLAQIASQGDVHLFISKSVRDSKTYTEVSVLLDEKRVYEIARIMGGIEITDLQLQSAREMLEKAGNL